MSAIARSSVMDANCPYLPYEITELIIDIASEPSQAQYRGRYVDRNSTVLMCALVCKSWVSQARRRLLTLYFPSGVVRIFSYRQDFLLFHDIFCSPLCTLDTALIQVLSIWHPDGNDVFPFSLLLSALHGISLPSLNTIRFHLTCPVFDDNGESDGTSSSSSLGVSSTLLSVKNLTFETGVYISPALRAVAKTIQFFPCLETLSVYGVTFNNQGRKIKAVSYPGPPQSLRKLVVDPATLGYLVKWLAAYNRTDIKSLSIADIHCGHSGVELEDSRLLLALDTLGHSLEEFELSMELIFSLVSAHLNCPPSRTTSSKMQPES